MSGRNYRAPIWVRQPRFDSRECREGGIPVQRFISRALEEYSHQDRLSALVLVANRFPKLGSVVQGLSLGSRERLSQSLKVKCRGKAFFFF